MRAIAIVPIALLFVVAACSNDVIDIHAESTGSAGAGGHSTQGSTSATTTTGAGGAGAGSSHAKIITADTDADQQVSGTTNPTTGVVIVGPFFLTDFVGYYNAWLSQSGDCINDPHAPLVINSAAQDSHALHVFVPANVTLCTIASPGIWFGGFRPY